MRPMLCLTLTVCLGAALALSARAEDETPDEATAAALDAKKIDVDFVDAEAGDIAAFFRDFSGLNFVVDAGIDAGDHKATIRSTGLTLGDTSRAAAKALSLEQVVWHGIVVWTTPDRATRLRNTAAPAAGENADDATLKAAKKLRTVKVDLNFGDAALVDILAFVQDISGVSTALQGGNPGSETLSIVLHNAALGDVLALIAFQLDLDVDLSDGVIIFLKK